MSSNPLVGVNYEEFDHQMRDARMLACKPVFTIKDSGVRKEFESGMVRDTSEDKTLWHLIFSGPMLKRWAIHLTGGAKKYSANNWMKASGQAELDRFKESAFRHFMQWYSGDRDEDHAAAVYFNINGAEYVRDKIEASNGKVPYELGKSVPVAGGLQEHNFHGFD